MDTYVGPYRILRPVDRGGQCEVFLGHDGRLDRRVAIKIHRLPEDRRGRRRLLREARMIAAMDSPRLVKVHDLIESGRYLAMVMEYVPGCSLGHLLAATRPSLASALTAGIDIAGALAVSRQHRVVHGDLSPRNILVGANGRARLSDFGIALRVRSGPGTRSAAGNLQALSPEHVRGDPLDWRSDMFALGILLYRMLGNAHPFYRDGKLDTDLLLHGSPVPLPEQRAGERELPAALVAAIDSMLEKDPAKRPRNTRGVRQAMRAALRELPLATHDSLLRESRPHFRDETVDDLALRIPGELGRDGRSRLPSTGGPVARLVHAYRGLTRPLQRATVYGLAGVLLLPFAFTLREHDAPVRLGAPQVTAAPGATLPPGVDSNWLQREVSRALREDVRGVRLRGNGARDRPHATISAHGMIDHNPGPEQTLDIALHCGAEFCLLAMERNGVDAQYVARSALLPGMGMAHWRDAVRSTTEDLFP